MAPKLTRTEWDRNLEPNHHDSSRIQTYIGNASEVGLRYKALIEDTICVTQSPNSQSTRQALTHSISYGHRAHHAPYILNTLAEAAHCYQPDRTLD